MTGAQLRAARDRAGWTQTQLAQRIGVSKETVCRWETGFMGMRRTSEVAVLSVLGMVESKSGGSKSRKSRQ